MKFVIIKWSLLVVAIFFYRLKINNKLHAMVYSSKINFCYKTMVFYSSKLTYESLLRLVGGGRGNPVPP